jgi:hypothetical protein
VTISLLVGAGAPAWAADGVLEINQACVENGCFPSDTPGFPVQAQPGKSHVLTSDLVVPDANTSAVSLGEAATLDLNGFAISGVTSCSGTPTTCTDSGTGIGVFSNGSSVIRNGTIRKMGSHGVSGADGTQVENVLIEQCGGRGISGGSGAEGWVITRSRIQLNGGVGIALAFGSGGRGSSIRDNSIYRNGDDGVEGTGLLLIGNSVVDNAGLGFQLNFVDGVSAFGENGLIGNNGGNANPQTSGGIQMGTNVCGSDTTCP